MFGNALKCVRSFVDFHLMAQYKTHTAETLGYKDQYLRDFHQYRDVFQEFRAYNTTKKAVKDRTKAILQSNPPVLTLNRFNRQRIRESCMSHRRRLQEMEEIREASHFNFIKMHLLTHFRQHVERFEITAMFSTESVDAPLQILDISTRRQAFELRLLNLKRLYYHNNSHGESSASSQQVSKNLQLLFGICNKQPLQIQSIYASGLLRMQLKHQNRAVNNLKCEAEELAVDLGDLGRCVLRFGSSEQGSASFRGSLQRILEDPTEIFACLQVLVPEFHEADRYQLPNLRCTGKKRFWNRVPRNDWGWIHAGEEHEWGALRGPLPARLQLTGVIRIATTALWRLLNAMWVNHGS
ncbi:hypothetical protein Q9L58_009707 [Maublancomyces gigas]|uniref:Uncharacterized protein n=1 Tax=Discina gigas TaxID=1032678 RepID=A0ABR3G650_9PEZI